MSKRLRQFARYIVTGGAAAVVDLGGFLLLSAAGLATIPAATLSFFCAAIVNYVATSHFVFGRKPGFGHFWIFLAGAILGATVNVATTAYAVAGFDLPKWAGKTLGIAVAFVFNFLLNAFAVFRRS